MQKLSRFSLTLLLLCVLCAGLFAPQVETVEAKRNQAADQVSVVISEFRMRGPNGADDEFIEIYNATGSSVLVANWKIRKSSGCGGTLTDLATIPLGVTLNPGQYYLIAKSGSYSGSVSADLLYTTAGVADDGGIALVDNVGVGNIIDQVGLCSTTFYKEGTALSSMTNSVEQSYERKDGGSAGSCTDKDNNSSDFIFNSATINPQNFSSPFLPCLVVTNVTTTKPNGTYTTGEVIDIDVTFSNNVNVTGNPILLLETGYTDRNSVYLSGSGTNTLTFRYTVFAGDSSSDLDYVSTNSLSLNGGTIIGAIGNAVLILPKVGQTGSLGFNKNIRIDSAGNPSVLSITRQNPATSPTNATSLTFRVTFSEAVTDVDINDFVVTGTTAMLTSVNMVNASVYDMTVSGGNLPGLNGVVGLDLSASPTIFDVNSDSLNIAEPSTDETYTVDNIAPTVTLNQASSQADPANTQPINFTVVFSEPINTSTFVPSDITHSGTVSGVVWTITNSGDNINFTLSATASSNGTLIPTISAGRVTDVAGNLNLVSTSSDNSVSLSDNVSPTVTINQSASQADPTSTLPINFTVIFSEPINASVFTSSDITQNGTATGITWSITNSGNNSTFTLSATASGLGTLIPSITANRVTDLVGNNNIASTSTDNRVTYALTPTATPALTRSVIINEIAWAGTLATLQDDEWIELYNPGSNAINITGWRITASDGTPNITLIGTIPANGYFLLEKDDDNTVKDSPVDIIADQIYTGNTLSNTGEALTLYDASNKVIDTANGNGGAWPAGSSSTYGTMERITGTSDSDSAWVTNNGTKRNGLNANGGNILGTPKNNNTAGPTPTPGSRTATPQSNAVVIPPRPIINEILARPGFDWNQDGQVNVFDEFIEIKNLTAIDITLSGWKLDKDNGSKTFVLPNVTLRPNERIVFYSLETNLLLSDGGETIRLINSSNKIYDAYTYTVAKAEDESFCRLPDGNASNSAWFVDCIPTPSQSNTREGNVPTSPDGNESTVCNLPDTIPADFFTAECKGYGANIWNPFYWDDLLRMWIQSNTSKWETYIE